MINLTKHITGEFFENQILDLTNCRSIDNSYLKNCEIIINRDEDSLFNGFSNVVIDNCKIRYIINGIEKSELPVGLIRNYNEPVKFINTKVNLRGKQINCFGYGNLGPVSVNDPRISYYISNFFKDCTLNNEPIKSVDVSKIDKREIDFCNRLESQLPVFRNTKEDLGYMSDSYASKLISDEGKDEGVIKRKDDYRERYAKLDAIEKATGEDMGFQKGMLDVEYGRTIYVKSPTDPNYSSYDEGVLYGMKKRDEMFQMFSNSFNNADNSSKKY